MWIAVTFDLPVVTAEERKNYRNIRKKLRSCGFSAVQKSFFWRWAENKEKVDLIINKVKKAVPDSGNIIFLLIADHSFSRGIQIENGKESTLPKPPSPWIILT